MKIYIDSDFKCHLSDDGTMTAVETAFFDGKCAEFIEGYRFIPSGSVWTRSDGVAFPGEMIVPWKDYRELDYAQVKENEAKARAYDILMGVAE